jgi:hypothetical protein
MVPKRWLYPQGGRRVIYQPDYEFDVLPESHKWRHVRYELDADPRIDFSWEREWRIKIDVLPLPPGNAHVLVPSQSWITELIAQHERAEQDRIAMDAIAYGDEWLWQDPDPFHYFYSILP